MNIELFHAIGDEGSAAARLLVVEIKLEDRVRFRNLAYPEVEADFLLHGGTLTPAIWNGSALIQGREPVLDLLRHLSTIP